MSRRTMHAALLSVLLGSCSSSPEPSPSDVRVDRQPRTDAPGVVDLSRPLECSASPGADSCAPPVACKLVKPYSSKNAVCNQCAESKCCAEVNGCLGDPACDDDYVNCTLVCALSPAPDAGMGACLGQCAKDYPKGKAEYDTAIGCADSKCATECT